jgi:hypothetical protein
VPKGPSGQKRKAPPAPKSKKLPRNLPEDPVSRAVSIMRTATKQDVGDIVKLIEGSENGAVTQAA